jgi:hypothetical protein
VRGACEGVDLNAIIILRGYMVDVMGFARRGVEVYIGVWCGVVVIWLYGIEVFQCKSASEGVCG